MEESTNINANIKITQNFSKRSSALLLGQLMSLCLSGTAVASQFLSNEKYNAPTGKLLFIFLQLFF
uniref:Uncharacterized protein n=1 Tax=Meloidogyne enterolobii TaxID=390850 RepID=A0A6V7W187_MELEN|nr:unnamed protein product [Meloidogyne enterolobii]